MRTPPFTGCSVLTGKISVEHYFEMSHSDATTSLKIYKHFCKETEKVVTYLGIAKKMQNVLNVQVPNLKHVRDTLVLVTVVAEY